MIRIYNKSQKTTSLQNRMITSAVCSGFHIFIATTWQVPILARTCSFMLAFFLTFKCTFRSICRNTQEKTPSTETLHERMQQVRSSYFSLCFMQSADEPWIPMARSLDEDFSIPSFLWILPWHPTLIFCMQRMSLANSYSVLPSSIV